MACYVPFCESAVPTKKGEKRKPGISFHQFPSIKNNELRLKWILAIGRKDPKTGAYWDPYSSAMVCSLHFSPKQFKGPKQSHLMPGSIPFIFPDYYLPQQGTLINQADLSSVELIPFPNNVNSEKSLQHCKSVTSKPSNTCESSNTDGLGKTNQTKRTFAEMNSSQTDGIKILNEQLSSGTLKVLVRIAPANKIQKLALSQPKNGENFAPETSSNVDLAKEDCSAPALSADSPLETNFRATGGDTNTCALQTKKVLKNTAKNLGETNKSPLPTLYSIRKQNQILAGEVLRLQEENKTLKANNRAIDQKLKAFNFEELNRGVVRSNAKALFIYDQLRSFAEKKCILSKSTSKFLEHLERDFPECYLFLTKTDIISLPPPTV